MPKFAASAVVETLEKPLRTGERHSALRIGVPREAALQENRVSLTPRAVGVLVANGHEVYVEHKAGAGSNFSDKEYTENGAAIVYDAKEVYTRADLIAKITPLINDELDYLKQGQTIISAVHMGNVQPSYLQALIKKSITAIGLEFITATDGTSPFVHAMSQIAGAASIQIAAELLTVTSGGQGLLLGSITGIPPVRVSIIGAGTVGTNAARAALALGAQVRVIDEDVPALDKLRERIGHQVYTAVAQPDTIAEAVMWADVLIGAAYIQGFRAPMVVTEDMVSHMREGSVIIDVAIDQGGCVETSRQTDHKKPTFIHNGVIHYCVPNIASRVARTGSMACSNILAPLLLKVGKNGGVKNSLGRELSIRSGIYVYHRHITHRALATLFGLNWMDIDLLYAADI
jgi:alanine dehydrogenase